MAIATSILIPTFNTRDLSVQCIRSIEKDPPVSGYEIILMENNSSDGTYEEVTRLFPHLRVMKNTANLGVGKACNRAAQEAKGKYFLLLNNDAKPLPGAIDQLVDWLETHPKTGIVGPQLTGAEGELVQMSYGWFPILHGELLMRFITPPWIRRSKLIQRWVRFMQRRPTSVPWVCGASALIRREAFEEIGGFDENFELYFEDTDLCQRCAEKGWTIEFIPQAKVIHHLSQVARPAMNEFSLVYQQSHIAYYRKHGPFWSVWLLKGLLCLKWLVSSGLSRLGSAERAKAVEYWSKFLGVVLEKQRISLPRGAPSTC